MVIPGQPDVLWILMNCIAQIVACLHVACLRLESKVWEEFVI